MGQVRGYAYNALLRVVDATKMKRLHANHLVGKGHRENGCAVRCLDYPNRKDAVRRILRSDSTKLQRFADSGQGVVNDIYVGANTVSRTNICYDRSSYCQNPVQPGKRHCMPSWTHISDEGSR